MSGNIPRPSLAFADLSTAQVEEFKLLLTPPTTSATIIQPPTGSSVEHLTTAQLPEGVTIEKVFSDLFGYLVLHAQKWFEEVTHG